MPSEDAKTIRRSIPDPREGRFRANPEDVKLTRPQLEAAREAAHHPEANATMNVHVESEARKVAALIKEPVENVPGYATKNLAAIDASKTAAENAVMQHIGKVPFGDRQNGPVSVQTDTAAAAEFGVNLGEAEEHTDHKTRMNSQLGAPV